MLSKNIDKDLVEALFNSGLTTNEVAKQLCIAPSTVTYWKKKLNKELSLVKYDWKEIQELYDSGLSYQQLYEKIGISKRALQMARNRGEFTPRKNVAMDPQVRKERVKYQRRESWMRYQSKKKYQTPADEDIKALQEFYANCPPGYEVDHIIPISKGGAHSLSNLQYLTKEKNRRKSNKIIRG